MLADFISTIAFSFAAFLIIYLIIPYAVPQAENILSRYPRLHTLLAQRRDRAIDLVFYLIVVVSLIGLSAESLHLYQSLNGWPEFGWNIDRVVLALLQGDSIIPYLAQRYNPIVIAFVPLYAVWRDPRILLVVQSAGFVVTAFPLYWFARKQIGRPLALTVVIAYLFSSSVQSLNNADTIELKFSIPLLAFALFFLLRQRYLPFLVSLSLALLVKEDIAFVAVGFAVFFFLTRRQRLLGSILAALGIGVVLFVTEFLYPLFHEGRPFYLWAERYAYLGNTFDQVVRSILLRPDIVFQHVLLPGRIDYILYLLVPLGLLPLIGIEVTAISLPTLAYSLLSEWSNQSDPTTYYQAPVIPFLFFGAVTGISRLLKWGRLQKRGKVRWALFALLIVSSQLYLPSTWTRIMSLSYFKLNQHALLGHQLMQKIPSYTKVGAQSEFFLTLLGTRQYDVFPYAPTRDAQYYFDFLFGDSTRFWYNYYKAGWEHWRASGYYDTVFEEDGYFLLRRKTSQDPSRQFDNGWALLGYAQTPNSFNHPLGFQFEDSLTLIGYAAVPSDKIQRGEQLRVIVEWRANQDIHAQYIVLAHLVDAQGHIWAQEDREPIIPTDRWQLGDIVRDQFTFSLSRIMPPGEYSITVAIWDPRAERNLSLTDPQRGSPATESVIGIIQVQKDTKSIPASYVAIEQPYYVDMREIRLLGSTTIPKTIVPGQMIELGLYWRARALPQGDYTVSVQLRDDEGRVVLEQVDKPAAGAYPTTLWHQGEVLLDWHDLTVPPDFPQGSYTIQVVLSSALPPMKLGETSIGEVFIGE